jgi:ribonucleoside-diphosphate reductase alpha chain
MIPSCTPWKNGQNGTQAVPFDTVEWELRSAAIKDENGEVLFEQTDCEDSRPGASWRPTSSSASTSTARTARPSASERPAADPSRHPHDRRLGQAADGYFATAEDGERFYRELTWLCLHQHGRSIRPSGSTWACTTSTA